MTPDDVVPFEMGANDRIADEQLERFVEDLRTSFPAQAPAEAETHLAAMFEAAHLLADKGDPAVRPVSNADAPAAQVSRLPKRRSSSMMDKKFLRSRGLRVLAPAIAAFTILGVMASANALPRSMQHAAATAASVVGVDLPDSQDTPDVQDTTDTQTPDAFGTTTDTQDQTDATNPDNNQVSTDPTSQDGNGQGEDTQDSTDATSQDGQGTDTQDSSDATSGDNQSGDSQGSGDATSQDSGTSGSDSQSSDSSGDTGGSSSGSDGGNSSGDSSGGDSSGGGN